MTTSAQDDAFLGQAIDLLRSGSAAPSGASHGGKLAPWEIRPSEYLAFAREDFDSGGSHGWVNALGNAKRALHCQVDSILYVLGLHDCAQRERWDFPKKLARCVEAGVVAPRTLRRLNIARNEVEHTYSVPEGPQQLEAYIDIVELFIAATRRLTNSPYDFIEFDISGETILDWLTINFDPENSQVLLEAGPGPYKRSGLIVPAAHPRYAELIGSAVGAYEPVETLGPVP